MSKAHPAPPRSTTSKRSARSAQSTTPAAQPEYLVTTSAMLRIDGHLIEQQALARESDVSKSLVSRLFSLKNGQRRKDPKLSTLLGLQRGLRKITGKDYSLDFVGELVTGRAA